MADTPGALIEAAVEEMFTPRPFVELTLADDTVETLNYHDFVSGAMIANVVDRAKKLAIKDHIGSGRDPGKRTGQGSGITPEHLRAAVRAEQDESEDLPNTANPDEWARITGRQGKRVVAAEVVTSAST